MKTNTKEIQDISTNESFDSNTLQIIDDKSKEDIRIGETILYLGKNPSIPILRERHILHTTKGGFFYAFFPKVKAFLFHTFIIPISFLVRVIVRSFANPEGFLNPMTRVKLLNPFHKGLLLNGLYDRLSKKDSFTNALVVAKVGGGKTSSFIIPNLLKLDNCSILTTDLSGELYEKTSGAMKQKGYEIKVINPTNLLISQRYNPLEFVSTHKEILEISHILIHTNKQNKEDVFWNNGAQKLLEIIISCLISQRERLKNEGAENYSKFCTLSQLRYLLNNFGENGKGLDSFISTYADYQTFHDFKGFVSGNEKTTQGFVATALTSLNIVGNKDIAKLTATNEIDFKEIRDKKTIIYLQIPEQDLHIYSFLISLFYTQFFNCCMQKLPKKDELDVFCLLDEAGHIKVSSHFSSIITNIRKYRVSISLIVQSLSQLENLYGKTDANTIINGGIATQIYFGGCDLQTCETLEKMMGNTITREIDGVGRTLYIKEPLMSVNEIRTMRNNEAILLFSNKKPVLLFMRPYFKHYEFKKLSEIVEVEYDKKTRNERVVYLDLKLLEKGEAVEADSRIYDIQDDMLEVLDIMEESLETEIFDQDTQVLVDNIKEKVAELTKEEEGKSDSIENEIDDLSNSDFKMKEISQEKYQEYMIGDDFDIKDLDIPVQTIVEIFKEKVIQIHLNKEFDDVSDSMKFHIKKRVKKIMDKPLYFDCLGYIRESVCYDVDNILYYQANKTAEIKTHIEFDIPQLEEQRAKTEKVVNGINDKYYFMKEPLPLFHNPHSHATDIDRLPGETYTQFCERRLRSGE